MSKHWTEEEYRACESAETFGDLLPIAFTLLEKMKQEGRPVVEICGPMTTGGLGSRQENFRLYNYAVEQLENNGNSVFNPIIFQQAMDRLAEKLCNGEYPMDILEIFYKGIFSSGYIATIYFLPDWESSKGATWERNTIPQYGITIKEYPQELLADFK